MIKNPELIVTQIMQILLKNLFNSSTTRRDEIIRNIFEN